MNNAELIAELRGHILSVPLTLLHDAADAIERLMDEVDRKDKAIQGLLTQIERKDKTIERMRDLMKHYKAAYRTAYKLYQEARNEIP